MSITKRQTPTSAAVYAALVEIITGPTDWEVIRKQIAERFMIENWLTEVRGPLQAGLNKGVFKRKPDLRNEIYFRK